MPIVKKLPCSHNLNESQNTPGLTSNLRRPHIQIQGGRGAGKQPSRRLMFMGCVAAGVHGQREQQRGCFASLSDSRTAFLHLQFKSIAKPLFEIGILLH